MKLNTKTRYGLRTMLEIALHSGERGILQKDIATSQNLSVKYLDQIISELKSANLIRTISGKKSGYKLTREAKEICIYDIYLAFNPPLHLVNCLNEQECTLNNSCASQNFWCTLNAEIISKLQTKTLADIVIDHKKLTNQIMFYI
ncbi:MAG: Rrf2 family transcriptional regulator [Bacteroidales bacterium]|jgi:Rrf2 family protein|nr:Rrf2 family transcriptional regulator [Bacteroidales bacterium]NLK81935.1 Rrf2 family transcriptional regulator [Bacteroidales bacterium]HPY82356.1 Rrf2 family transcriptional regulator [Bacteroidales bacterium]